ncbi:MAG: hypothetical protein II308_06835, partial [Muribaculaceae bacterium]|nr:hypothetical protein [Muribaculaceae bacterium]
THFEQAVCTINTVRHSIEIPVIKKQSAIQLNARFAALAVKNTEASFVFLARLLYLCDESRRFTALAVKNTEASFVFLARLLYLCEWIYSIRCEKC